MIVKPLFDDQRCQCPGCSLEHPEGEQCPDAATAAYGLIGTVIKGVCVECLVELVKKLANG